MSALLDGFRTGYDRMNQYQQQEENKRRYDQGYALQRKQFSQQQESHNANMENSALNRQILQDKVDNLPIENEYQSKLRDKQMEVSALNLDTAKQKNSQNKDLAKQQRALSKLKAAQASGRYDSIVGDKDFEGTDVQLIFNGTGRKAAIALNQSIKAQDWGGAVEHFNTLYKPKLNKMAGKEKGRDGGEILDVKAIDFVVGESGTVRVPVQVTTDKGVYNSYISELRTSSDDDSVKEFSVESLLGKGATLGSLANIMESAGVNNNINQNAGRYFQPANSNNGTPAEVKTMQMLSEMSGIPVKQLVEAKYMSQKDPSGATLRKTALQLAQKDPRMQYIDDSEPEKIKAIIDEYTAMLAEPQQSAIQQPANQPTPQYSKVLQQAASAIQSGKDRNAVIQRLIDMGVPQDQINL